MNYRIPQLMAALVALVLSAQAQTTSLEVMRAARNFRQELALSVSQNLQSPGQALAMLRANKGASGRAAAAEDDFAYAALDVGYRLLAMERPAAAEEFFLVAEQGLMVVANRSNQPRERAEHLRQLALLRGRYLNKIAQAKADIEEAIRLQPEDPSLKETRALIARGRGEHFKPAGRN